MDVQAYLATTMQVRPGWHWMLQHWKLVGHHDYRWLFPQVALMNDGPTVENHLHASSHAEVAKCLGFHPIQK
jgi:hypothetical protein